MAYTLTGLRTLLGLGNAPARRRTHPASGRNVMMRVTLDAQHATPLRQALVRDCGDQQWTIRIAPLPGTDRVRLSLYLPRSAVSRAMQRVAHLAPSAEVGRLLEIPDAPTEAWRDLMRTEPPARVNASRHRADAAKKDDTLVQLLSEDHVLLGVDVEDREALFVRLGRVFEQRCGLSAANVTAGLAAREALGSTGLGQGVAVPHGQIEGLRQALAFYVRPVMPIPFDAPDGRPVGDVVVLLVPEWANSTHLRLLADVAQRFCDHRFREALHGCVDAHAVYRLFADYESPDNAADAITSSSSATDAPTLVKHAG